MNKTLAKAAALIAAAALIGAACSNDSPRPSETTQPNPAAESTDTSAENTVETDPNAEATDYATDAPQVTDAPPTTESQTTESQTTESQTTESQTTESQTTEPPTTEPAETSAPSIQITDGPVGVTNGRDAHGEGGTMSVTWEVTPDDSECSFALTDTDGESVVHQIEKRPEFGVASRTLEVLYSVEAGGLPISVSIACRTDGGTDTQTVQVPIDEQFEPTRWDHDEIADTLPNCSPPHKDRAWRDWEAGYDAWDAKHEGWESRVPLDEWSTGTPSRWRAPGVRGLHELSARLSADGYDPGRDAAHAWRWVTDEGIVPHRTVEGYDPDRALQNDTVVHRAASLLFEWTAYRYQFPPTGDEPTAWAMRTLLNASDPSCVADAMLIACAFDDLEHSFFDNPHLRYDADSSSVGRALWSIVCGKAPTTERLGDDS